MIHAVTFRCNLSEVTISDPAEVIPNARKHFPEHFQIPDFSTCSSLAVTRPLSFFSAYDRCTQSQSTQHLIYLKIRMEVLLMVTMAINEHDAATYSI